MKIVRNRGFYSKLQFLKITEILLKSRNFVEKGLKSWKLGQFRAKIACFGLILSKNGAKSSKSSPFQANMGRFTKKWGLYFVYFVWGQDIFI